MAMSLHSDIKVVISGDESTSLTALRSNIVKIKGVIRDDAAESESRVGLRGGELSDFIPLIVSGFAIPAFLKAIEVFILTRKIELEIQLPDKNAKLKLSGINEADLKAKMKEFSTIFKNE